MGQHDPESPLLVQYRYRTNAQDRADTNEAAANYLMNVLKGVVVLTPTGLIGWLLFQQVQ